MLKTNYVLIDYENLQPVDIAVLNQEFFQVVVFVGANQSRIPFELANEMQKLGERGKYVKISGNGSNALDFHIAFYIGQLAAQDTEAYFHILSKDSGFDPLIQHLKEKGIRAARSTCIADIPLLKIANSKTMDERVQAIVANLQQRGASKPRTLKTLSGTVASLFQKQLPEGELEHLLQELQKQGFVAVKDTKVSYDL